MFKLFNTRNSIDQNSSVEVELVTLAKDSRRQKMVKNLEAAIESVKTAMDLIWEIQNELNVLESTYKNHFPPEAVKKYKELQCYINSLQQQLRNANILENIEIQSNRLNYPH